VREFALHIVLGAVFIVIAARLFLDTMQMLDLSIRALEIYIENNEKPS
jgi:hypothetical protein